MAETASLFLAQRPGFLERGGRTFLVTRLFAGASLIGHVRQDGELWRWVVYPDASGDEATKPLAVRIAQFCWATLLGEEEKREQSSSTFVSARQIGPSSRRPGSKPRTDVVHVSRDAITPEDRAERTRDATAWATALG